MTEMPADEFFDDNVVEIERAAPTADDPLRGLTHLGAVAIIGRARLHALAASRVTYAWQDYAVAGTIVLLASGPSEGKTTLLFLILVARASLGRGDRPANAWLLEREVHRAPQGRYLVLIEGEHSESSAARKLLGSAAMLEIDEGALDRIIMIARKAVRLGSPEWRDVVRLIAAGLVSDLAIDTVARVAPGEADDERSQVAIFDEVTRAIEMAPAGQERPTVWACAHTRKNGGGDTLADVSGSTQRTGQADSVLLLRGCKVDGRTVATRVVAAKLREEPDEYPAPVTYSIERDEVGHRHIRVLGDEGEGGANDGRPLEDRILDELRAEPRTKTALRERLRRSSDDIEAALSTLFAARRIRTVDTVVGGRSRRAFSLVERWSPSTGLSTDPTSTGRTTGPTGPRPKSTGPAASGDAPDHRTPPRRGPGVRCSDASDTAVEVDEDGEDAG